MRSKAQAQTFSEAKVLRQTDENRFWRALGANEFLFNFCGISRYLFISSLVSKRKPQMMKAQRLMENFCAKSSWSNSDLLARLWSFQLFSKTSLACERGYRIDFLGFRALDFGCARKQARLLTHQKRRGATLGSRCDKSHLLRRATFARASCARTAA